MINPASGIQIAMLVTGGARCEALLTAIKDQGWHITLLDSLEALVTAAESGRFHLALVATGEPQSLPRSPARDLLSMQADVAIIFLIPWREAVLDSPALRGTTSDQVLRLETAAPLLIQILSQELQSVTSSQPHYRLVCVDDDKQFLASLEAFMPAHLERAFPRFRLDFDFFDSPVAALAALRETTAGQLALVISDQVMPVMPGIDLLRQVKELAPAAQRVLLTGYASLDSAILAMNEHVLDKYLTKPIEQPADFVNTLEHLLRSYHLSETRHRQRARLMAQFEFIRAVTAAADLEAACRIVCDFLQEQLAAPQAAILLRDAEQWVVRAAGQAPAAWPTGTVLALRQDFLEVPTAGLRPRVACHAAELPWIIDPGAPGLTPPLLWVPLNWGETNLGFVALTGFSSQLMFGREQRMLISFVADVASVTCGGLKERAAQERLYLATMSSLMEAVEAKDQYTRGHTERVKDYALLLARAGGAGAGQLKEIEYAAALHDIGKISVPDSIINKPGRLTDEELTLMKAHSDRGDRILRPLGFLNQARHSVRSHHERYDGRGYPDGLAGDQIPLAARILAIADSYDAMTSVRPYRQAMDPREALAEIEVGAGSQFDPVLAALFVRLLKSWHDVPKTVQPRMILAGQKEEQ